MSFQVVMELYEEGVWTPHPPPVPLKLSMSERYAPMKDFTCQCYSIIIEFFVAHDCENQSVVPPEMILGHRRVPQA